MTDRELDRMMQHVLLDAIKRDCEKETDDVPAFKPTRHYQRDSKSRYDLACIYAQPGKPYGSQPHGTGRSGALGHGMV